MSYLPETFLLSLQNAAGFDRAAFVAAHEQESITSVRYNPEKISFYKGDFPKDKIAWNPYGYYLSERPSFTQDPFFHAGLYYVQEAASQFLWEVLSQNTDRNAAVKALDLCAAPGGKTTLLASYFNNGLIVANETIKSRVNVLAENATKWGTNNMVVCNNDAKHFARLKNYFDLVLADVPCSGSGLFRKDKTAVDEWSEENVLLCSRRQQRILADVYPALKQNGLLIYATCSYALQEDEEILDWLMENFSLENISLEIPLEWGITQVVSSKHRAMGYKFFPNKTRSEGFFIAVFRKKDGEDFFDFRTEKLSLIHKNELAEISSWIEFPNNYDFVKQQNFILSIPKKWYNDIALLQQNLYLKKAGISIGELKNKGLVPAHDLAVSTIFARNIRRVNLDKLQSLQYLKRQEIALSNVDAGWVLANFEGLNLGWMKVLSNRINNYYPAEWRILKH